MQIVFIIVAVLVVSLVGLNMYARYKMKYLPQIVEHDSILILTDKNFIQQIKGKVVLVDFWADWCMPCRMMAPVLNELAQSLTVGQAVAKVDVAQYASLAQQFNVRNIPTMILFKDGKEVKRFVGIKQKEFLLKEMQNF